jgi:penicillin-binding protein 2
MEFKNPQEELERFRSRLAFAGGFVLFCFALLFIRFVWLQVVQHDYYQTRAEDNRISLVPIVPNRGLIVDRNGAVLARNYSAYTLEITPSRAGDLEKTIDGLATIIEIEAKDRRRFKKLMDESKSFETLPIRTRLSDEEVAKFIAHRYRFPGVEIKARLFRQYPGGAFASHILGYIGRITDRDLEKIEAREEDANYRGTDHFGKTGLEQRYEFDLHGVSGHEQVEVDAGGRAVRTLTRTPPVAGNQLTLTIDAELQRIAEHGLWRSQGFAGGDRARHRRHPGHGFGAQLRSQPVRRWHRLAELARAQRIAGQADGQSRPERRLSARLHLQALHGAGGTGTGQAPAGAGDFRSGLLQFRRPPFPRRQEGRPRHGGHVQVHRAFLRHLLLHAGQRHGHRQYRRFMGRLGLGQRTGIDIDGESEGVLPSQEWKKERFKKPEQQKWYAGETISIGIGQGYNAYTPIQLAQATATIANNGVMFRPHLVKYVTDTRSGDKRLIEPEPLRDLQAQAGDVEVIRNAMVGVNKEGTGARAFAKAEYVAAGKTGTAQVFSYKGAEHKTETMAAHCATMRCSSPSRRPTSRPSRWPCWSRTAASAPRRRRRSRARCSTTICSARSPRRRRPGRGCCRRRRAMNPGLGLATLREWWHKLVAPLDAPLLLIAGLLVLLAVGVMASASPERVNAQLLNVAVALVVMRILAQVPPQRLMHLAVPIYLLGVLLLVGVALFGDISKGARRWLNLGFMRIQPSE